MTCAYYLSRHHDITLFEAADYIGGHTHTVKVAKEGEISWIDTGFIVFNDRTYPNFLELLNKLGVAYQPTSMSFSVKNDHDDLEYASSGLNALFAQRTNLVRPKFYRMLLELLRFNQTIRKKDQNHADLTMGQFLEKGRYSAFFKENYVLPMIAAIWSMGPKQCMDFPLKFFARFFNNHGLLSLRDQPQWYTIMDGSISYIKPLTTGFKRKIRLNTPVLNVSRQSDGVSVETATDATTYDEVIFACHGDQALAILSQPTDGERNILSEFSFSDNQVVLHTDVSQLPRRAAAWASWNYHMVDASKELTTLTYNMNILQRINKQHTYLVTLNQEIAAQHQLLRFTYSHPVYTAGATEAQKQWHTISGRDRIHFCGAYWLNGFHEDGVKSALRVYAMLEGSA